MARAYGSNASLLLKREVTYGVNPGGNFYDVYFNSATIGAEQGLIDDAVLGQGRDPLQPLLDVVNDEGDIAIPLDPRYLGLWLTGIFGTPVTTQVAATGTITFSANPSNNQTITLNGVAWTFKTSGATGNQTNIQGSLAATLTQLVTDLNASSNTSIDDATYSANATILTITHDTVGAAGNSFALAASVATVSGATLSGGGYAHTFKSGSFDLPSYTLEVGMPEIPAYFEHVGCRFNSIGFNFERSGAAAASVNVIAQGERRNNTSQGGTPQILTFNRISQFQGAIKQGGTSVANLTSGNMTYSNNMEKIETIRSDGKIDGADPTIASLSGNITVRYSDNTLIDQAVAGVPVDLEFSYTINAHSKLVMTAHEMFISKPKLAVEGPGGIQQNFEFRGAKNTAAGCMLTVVLRNDLDGSQYA